MKNYLVTYVSVYDFHEHFRVIARDKATAKRECKRCMGNYCRKVVEVEEEI